MFIRKATWLTLPRYSRPFVEFFLDADPIWKIGELVEADVLILAKGSFSLYAALISDACPTVPSIAQHSSASYSRPSSRRPRPQRKHSANRTSRESQTGAIFGQSRPSCTT
jgi:hypothetical protein